MESPYIKMPTLGQWPLTDWMMRCMPFFEEQTCLEMTKLNSVIAAKVPRTDQVK